MKNKAQHELEEELAKKTHVAFSEDFVSLTVKCYMKENIKKLMLVPAKRAQMFWAALTAQFMVVIMLICMYKALQMNELGHYTPIVSGNFWLFLVKFPTMYALHFLLTPEVSNGMNIMKYTNQQTEAFTPAGSVICFILGFNQAAIGIFCQIMNIYMLAYQQTISYSLIHFVSLEVIIEFPKLYFEALVDGPVKHLLHKPSKIYRSGRDIEFSGRTYFHKFARILYKAIRTFYVSIIYYFIPYTIFIVHWTTPIVTPEVDDHH